MLNFTALGLQEASRLSSENEHMREQILKLQESSRTAETQIEMQRISNMQLEQDIKSLSHTVETLKETLKETEDRAAKLQKDNDRAKDKLKETETKLHESDAIVNAYTDKDELHREELASLSASNDTKDKKLAAMGAVFTSTLLPKRSCLHPEICM